MFHTGHKVPISLLVLLVLPLALIAQNKAEVKIVQADSWKNNQNIIKNANRLLGDVIIDHADIRMWCDSAYMYSDTNIVDAFGHVHILKADTLNMYARYIRYNGDTKWALATGNVKLVNKTVTLTTDTLNYDMNQGIGYYDDYGTVQDSTNTLHSRIGEYYTRLDRVYFKTEVDVTTDSYQMISDTLVYQPKTGITSIVGPTTIFNEKDTLIATAGFYNTQSGDAELHQFPVIKTEGRNITASSIYYNKQSGDGLAIGQASIHDVANQVIIKGNRIAYNDIKKESLVNDSALALFYTAKDTLFMHADTLKTVADTIPNENIVQAYFNVKFFRNDLQGKCDSLVYYTKDSTLCLFNDPVLWSGDNQMTSDYMEMVRKDSINQEFEMKQNAFIIAREDTVRYNQIKGRNMKGYITRNDLYRIDVDGNGQSVYYAKDDKGLIGLNKAQASTIQIRLQESKVTRISFFTTPDGQLVPLADISELDKLLPGFNWREDIRPKSFNDIFIKEK
ncbi:OstA-like protein [Mangrovibacterium marinum]|uniref:OstA-like protein n=1 Tax=Mangrovibacterium marinum TaxID=1639118 RepID=A0A2T5BY20_9BACT|nr:OstA-like protein [Mangrovibacterium marinum]PTN06342.1 OstA-like protein [Mangrovibacterium marinum]